MSRPITEKITEQAVKQHDHLHPTFRSTSSTSKQRSQSQTSKPDDLAGRRRSRNVSLSETLTARSPVRSNPMGMSIFRIVAGARAWHQKAKQNSARNSRPRIKMENTYRMEPREDLKFRPDKVNSMLKDILESRLNDTTYDPSTAKKLSLDLSAFIKLKVKALGFPRYKIVVNVTIIENLGQGIHDVSRSLWNADVDSFATYTFVSPSVIAIAYVHAVYFE